MLIECIIINLNTKLLMRLSHTHTIKYVFRNVNLLVWHIVFVEPDVSRRIGNGAQSHLSAYMQVGGKHVTRYHVTGCDVTQLGGQLVHEFV